MRRTAGRGNVEEGGRGGQETRGCLALQEVEETMLPTTPCLWGWGSNKYIRHEKSEEPLETGSAFHKWKEKEQISCYQAGLWRKHALHLRNLQPRGSGGMEKEEWRLAHSKPCVSVCSNQHTQRCTSSRRKSGKTEPALLTLQN